MSIKKSELCVCGTPIDHSKIDIFGMFIKGYAWDVPSNEVISEGDPIKTMNKLKNKVSEEVLLSDSRINFVHVTHDYNKEADSWTISAMGYMRIVTS